MSRLRQLRAIRDGGALPSMFGSVLTHPVEDSEEDVQPAPALTVSAQSGEREYLTQTANDGSYEFIGLPRGEYYVKVQAPAGRLVLWGGGADKVRTPAGLTPVCPLDFEVFWDGRLSGTVVSRNGPLPPGYVSAEYVHPDKQNVRTAQTTIKDGRFELLRLSPGRYRLHFRAEGVVPSAAFYYPATTDESEAVLIEVGEGEHVGDLQIVIF